MVAQGFSRRRRLLVLAICCMSLFIAGLDSTIVNVALPSIQRDLHAPVSGLQWTVDAYTLVLASFLILSGSTGDRVGRRRIFQTGLVLFILGSLLCSLAPGLGWLVAFRVLQAIGGSMLNPVALSIISNTFTDPAERARAIGIWGSVFGVSLALGPVLGGALIASVGWRGIFWVNVPVGLAALVLSALFVPESRAPSGAMLTRLATGTPASWLITCYLALGVGTGMVNPAITNTAVSGMPPSQAGVAAAIASTSRQVGTALGVAVMGSAVLSALHGPLRLGFAGASHVGWWIITGCGAAVLLLAIITTGRWAKATAERAASRTAPGSPKVPCPHEGISHMEFVQN
jgi:MFS family permease